MSRTMRAGMMVALAAGLMVRDVRPQVEPPASLPAQVRKVIGGTGAVAYRVIAQPDQFNPSFVARLQFAAERPGFKACEDHYPAYYVPEGRSCPSLANNDPPAAGWVACHGEFYSPEKAGCLPQPSTPTAPLTTPRPKCTLGPKGCADQAPGGPVLIRTLRPALVGATVAAPPVAAPPAAPAGGTAPVVRDHRTTGAAARPAPQGSAPTAASRPASGVTGTAATPRATGTATTAGTPPAPRARVTAETATTLLRTSPKMRQWMAVKPRLRCVGQQCEWGESGQPITLPAPRVTPRGHVPCEYEHVSFFVPENRFCPDPAKDRPPPGVASYVSWSADNSTPPEVYFHRPDYNGRDKYAYMLMGQTDDRFLITEATERERAAADSTVVLVKRDHVAEVDAATVRLQNESSWQPLCSGERFATLPRPGRCSGVKIGNRLVATSAHCVRNSRQCDDTSVVLGFPGRNGSATSVDVPRERVYQCVKVIASRQPATIGERGADWTIFEVDRDMDGPSALLAGSADVRPSVVTTVIGHPLGLPSIVTRLGVVQVAATNYFIANSDTFVGNSGSAVFSAQSVEDGSPRVLGLLTGGQYDFVDTTENGRNCVQAKWCRGGPQCLGDDVVYADDLKKELEKLGAGPGT